VVADEAVDLLLPVTFDCINPGAGTTFIRRNGV
jgi:hypothetical protein